MNLPTLIKKLKQYGAKGVLDFAKAKATEAYWRGFFTAEAKKHPLEPVRGLTIVSELSSRGSVWKTMRDFCFSVKECGIPFQTFDLGRGEIPPEDIDPILTPRRDFHIKKYTHLIELLASPVPDGLVPHRGRIVFWEFENGILDAYPQLLERGGDVLPMSDFNFEYLRGELGAKREVHKILYPLRIDTGMVSDKATCRKKFGLAQDEFVVFYNFSYASGWNRKNAEGAVKAFAKAFSDTPNARLVFKTSAKRSHKQRATQLLACAKAAGVEKRILFIDDYLTQSDIYNLTNACDVYLSLHRSEGFGLGIAEAMMLGKAVVVTGYSAPLEFCDETNACVIPFKMIPVDCPDVPWYSAAETWADANIADAAAALRRLYEDSALRQRLGNAAKATILSKFSIEAFSRSINSYLK